MRDRLCVCVSPPLLQSHLPAQHWAAKEPNTDCGQVFETPHPYPPGLEMYEVIHFPGAPSISVAFSDMCHTEPGHDYVTFYKGRGLFPSGVVCACARSGGVCVRLCLCECVLEHCMCECRPLPQMRPAAVRGAGSG